MTNAVLTSLIVLTLLGAIGCQSRNDSLSAINMLQIIPARSGQTFRSRGIVYIDVSAEDPSHTFWNDWDTKSDPWGTLTLLAVQRSGTVRIDLSGFTTEALPGDVFPGTGIKLLQSSYEDQSAKLWSRWTRTVTEEPPGSGRDAGE
ncbi:MAG: hypothetical protein AB8C95_02455 [Phycisphaeraceae bacterium]